MKTPKGPYILAAFGIGLLTLLVYAFVYMPKISQAKDLDLQRQSVVSEEERLQASVDVVATKLKNLPALEGKVDEFNRSFPSGPLQRDLLVAVLSAGTETSVTVTGINPAVPAAAVPAVDPKTGAAPTPAVPVAGAAVAPAGPLAEVNLTINASGDAANLLAFMQRIESMKRPFTATEVTMTKGDGPGILTLTGKSFLVSPLVKPSLSAEKPAEGAADAASAPAVEPAAGTK